MDKGEDLRGSPARFRTFGVQLLKKKTLLRRSTPDVPRRTRISLGSRRANKGGHRGKQPELTGLYHAATAKKQSGEGQAPKGTRARGRA